MDFIIDNWPWLLAIVVFFVMAIIGYYSEKTGYTKKIKFKKEKELPTFDIDVDPLKDVEEVDTKVVTENQAEEEFKTSKSAEKVAEKLKKISSKDQTIVITHSAHIAAKSDKHFLIKKVMTDTETKTKVVLLDKEGRIAEIARINAGATPSETAIAQACEMLEEN